MILGPVFIRNPNIGPAEELRGRDGSYRRSITMTTTQASMLTRILRPTVVESIVSVGRRICVSIEACVVVIVIDLR